MGSGVSGEGRGEKGRLYCPTCKVTVNSASQLQAHNTGQWPQNPGEVWGRETPSTEADGLGFLGTLPKGFMTEVLCSGVIGWAFGVLLLMLEVGELGREVGSSKN